MKNRLLRQLVIVPLLIIFIASGLSGAIQILGPQPKASAGTTPYFVLNLPTDGSYLGKLKDAVSNGRNDENSPEVAQTEVWAKGGVFKDKPVKLTHDPDATSCAQKQIGPSCGGNYGGRNAELYVYRTTYGCEKGGKYITEGGDSDPNENWVVQFVVSVHLGGNEGIFDGQTLKDRGTLHWEGLISTEHYTKTQDGVGRDVDDAELPRSCMPAVPNSVADAADGGEQTGGAQVDYDIMIFPKLTAAQQKTWPGVGKLDSNSGPDDGLTTGSGSTGELDCHAGWNPLNWLICGIVNGLVQVVNGVDSIINQLLSVGTTKDTLNGDPVKLFKCPVGDTDTCDISTNPYYKAWSSFRNIALGLLVIACLVAIISQAVGMELLDAYTIRRVLPRLIFITILITISWPLLEFAVQLSNSLGYGIRGLIMFPFAELDTTLDIGGGGQGVGVMLATGAAIYAMGIFALLSFVATAALAAFVAFLTLVIRQILVILLVIVAPVALVCYILPNTQRFYKIWFQSFSGALLMFPIIAAMIATGRVFSAVAINAGGQYGGNALGTLIAFAAYFAPYFLIPTTFKMSGAAMGAIGGFINSRAQGGFQGLGKFRAGQREKMKELNKSGTRWQGKTWIPGSMGAARAGNFASKSLGSGWNGRFGFAKRGEIGRAAADQMARDTALKDPKFNVFKGKNDVMRVLAEGMGNERRGKEGLKRHLLDHGGDDGHWGEGMTAEQKEAAAEAQASDAVRMAKVAGGFTQANGVAGLYNMARDGTAIRDTNDLARLSAIAGKGDANNTYTYAAETAGMSRQAGRPDLAAASEPIGALAFAHSDILNKGGTLYSDKVGKAKADLEDLEYDAYQSGAGGESMYMLLSNGKSRSIRFPAQRAANILAGKNSAGQSRQYTDEQKQEAAATLAELQMGVENGHGRLNNRTAARKILETAETTQALESYKNQETGRVDPATGAPAMVQDTRPAKDAAGNDVVERFLRPEQQKDRIATIIGDRQAKMTDEQRRQMAEAGQNENENEP